MLFTGNTDSKTNIEAVSWVLAAMQCDGPGSVDISAVTSVNKIYLIVSTLFISVTVKRLGLCAFVDLNIQVWTALRKWTSQS